MRVCDNCKREPEPMETDLGETAWFFIIGKQQDEPIVLMSNLEWMFQMCLDRNPVLNEGEQAICNQCFLVMYPEQGGED